MTRTVELTQGPVALVDDEDFPIVSEYTWYPIWGRSQILYAGTHRQDESQSHVAMHTLITGYKQTDHIDGDGLNNQRYNLRPATHSQNFANSKLSIANTSGYKGVTRDRHRWRAVVFVDYKRIYLGLFDYPEDAAIAYDHGAMKHFGEYARTNGIMGLVQHDNCGDDQPCKQ